MYAHISVSQVGLYQRGTWVEHPLTSLPFGLQGAFSVHVWWGRAPDFGNERYVVRTCPSSSFNCPAILVLEFLSIENESPIALPLGAHLHSASVVLSEAHSFSGGSDSKASAYNTGDLGSIPGLERSPREGNGNPLQYSRLENPMDGGTW